MRHGPETFKKRLHRLEEKAAQEEGIVYTEAQPVALEQAKGEKETDPDEIETHHPGYLISQDTLYVGYLKGVGRIYQQTVIPTLRWPLPRLGLHEIDHTRTKAMHPQTNGICERFHQTCLNEFYQITFRKKIYRELDTLQTDLDAFLQHYNNERTHQGKRCQGRTPLQTFLDARELAYEKRLAAGAAAENGPQICSSEAAATAAR